MTTKTVDQPVRNYMTSPLLSVEPHDSLSSVQEKLVGNQISCVAVCDGPRLVGVISRTDLLRVGSRTEETARGVPLLRFPDKDVATLMNQSPVTVAESASVRSAAEIMVERHIHRVFVTKGPDCVGVLSTRDVITALSFSRAEAPISSSMTSPVLTVEATQPISEAASLLDQALISGVVVLENDWPIGIFTQVEALASKDLPGDTRVDEVMDSGMLCLPHDTAIYRAAQRASALRVRRLIAVKNRHMSGILTGIDFARFARDM